MKRVHSKEKGTQALAPLAGQALNGQAPAGQAEEIEVIIRNFSYKDLKKHERHLVRIYKKAYQGLEQYAYRHEIEIRGYIRWLYSGDPDMFLVACNKAGEAIGFVAGHRYWSDRQLGLVGNIHEFVVDPDFQGRGIGRALFEEILRRFSHEHSTVILWVGEKNLRAIQFYQKRGFECQERRGKWIKMKKDL